MAERHLNKPMGRAIRNNTVTAKATVSALPAKAWRRFMLYPE